MNKFEATLKLLADSNVKFVVIGGYAAMLQGSVILTRDLDICYERSAENLTRLASALSSIHAKLRGLSGDFPFSLDSRTLAQGMNFTLQTDLVDLDLLGEISGVGRFSEVVRDAARELNCTEIPTWWRPWTALSSQNGQQTTLKSKMRCRNWKLSKRLSPKKTNSGCYCLQRR